MDPFPYLIVGLVTSVFAGAITIVGDRAQRAVGRGVSAAGLTVGALLGGVLIAAFDLLVALLITLVWDGVRPAIGASSLPLLSAFIVVAVIHVWATTALAQRSWQTEPVKVDRERDI